MPRPAIRLILVLTLAALLPALPVRSQGEPCRFVLGFAALRERVGAAKVGSCLEDERSNAENGNAEQRTSGGLLVWRKADNFTAFTDGSTSWIAGPNGLQSRPNVERFAWERDPVQPSATRLAASPAPAASPAAAVPTSTLSPWVAGQVAAENERRATATVMAAPAFGTIAEHSGRWGGHGRGLTLEANGTAVYRYRTYTPCELSSERPCDGRGEDFNGGKAMFTFTAIQGDTIVGRVDDANDPKRFPKGNPIRLVLKEHGTADLVTGSESPGGLRLCGPKYDQAPDDFKRTSPCGA